MCIEIEIGDKLNIIDDKKSYSNLEIKFLIFSDRKIL